EWCSDWYGEYPKGAVSDPTGPCEGSDRVFRGGTLILLKLRRPIRHLAAMDCYVSLTDRHLEPL
ncbi:MAG: hypothetical protein ACOVQM_14585, partial [Pirellula sp.]